MVLLSCDDISKSSEEPRDLSCRDAVRYSRLSQLRDGSWRAVEIVRSGVGNVRDLKRAENRDKKARLQCCGHGPRDTCFCSQLTAAISKVGQVH